MRPQELEVVLEEDENFEHPRHLSLAEKVPSPRDQDGMETFETSEMTESRFAVETKSEMTEEETETSQTIKETQTFVIRGVIDPRTNEEISIYMVTRTKLSFNSFLCLFTQIKFTPNSMKNNMVYLNYLRPVNT